MTDTAALGQPPADVTQPDPGDLQLWGVTTIIGALDKPALLYWAAQMAAEAAIDNQRTWHAMLEDRGRAEAVKWLRDARFRRPKDRLSATDLGSAVHQLCEEYALTGSKPDKTRIASVCIQHGGDEVDVKAEGPVAAAMLDQFDSWLQRFTPDYQATEVTLYNRTYGYAGTADAFATVAGVRAIVDYKTSRNHLDSQGKPSTPYPEQVGLQLAAYRHAEFAAVWRPRRVEKFRRRYYLLGNAERELAVPVPQVDTGLVIHITPESCEAYPIRCDQPVFNAYLHVQECFRWLNETSKTIMQPPLEND